MIDKDNNYNYLIFDTQPGGIGKNVMATSVIAALKKEYKEKKIILVSPYPEIFLHNPDIYRTYLASSLQYFYDDYIKGKNTLIFKQEPYNNSDYIQGKIHLINSWYNECKLNTDKIEPLYIKLTDREIQYCINKYKIDCDKKGLVVFQPFGGNINLSTPYDWARDIPISQANEIVQRLLLKKYVVCQVRNPNHVLLDGCFDACNLPIRELICLIAISDKRILIDSSCQHIAAALNLHSVVLWIVNKPENLGYNIHNNILCQQEEEFRHDINAYFTKYDWSGQLHYQYPYNGDKLFDIDDILVNF